MKLVLLFAMLLPCFLAVAQVEPIVPQHLTASTQAIQTTEMPAPGLTTDAQGHVALSRWMVGLAVIKDPNPTKGINGWYGSGRIDYRLDPTYGLNFTIVNTTVSGGLTFRLGHFH